VARVYCDVVTRGSSGQRSMSVLGDVTDDVISAAAAAAAADLATHSHVNSSHDVKPEM